MARTEMAKMMEDDPKSVVQSETYQSSVGYPVLSAQPPVATAFGLTKASGPGPPPTATAPGGGGGPPPGGGGPNDDIGVARREVEEELRARQDDMELPEGRESESRASTPATQNQLRKDKDFVRRNLSIGLQQQYLRRVSKLDEIVRKTVKVPWESKPAYTEDLRVRATTCRIACGIEPPHLRMALERSGSCGAKWNQMFRPGFNDIVNESFKVGCNACILSKTYLNIKQEREQFQKMHIKDINGTIWFELQRQKDSIYYQRMDFVDVQMYHPEAWGFPDASKIVTPNPGEPIDPFHGWCIQKSLETDNEMEDVDFLYTLRLRRFPERTFQALALGKIPPWISQYMDIHASENPGLGEDTALEEDDGAEKEKASSKKAPVEERDFLMESGMRDEEDTHITPEELLKRDKQTGIAQNTPEVLDAQVSHLRLKGKSAMRIFLRSRGNPDNVKQCHITPKMVKDMAAQLGIKSEPGRYWYCMFALRYPLASEWEVIVKNDTRFYVHLPTDRLQIVHPMIKAFREHHEDCRQNEFLWEYRGFVEMKCSECGIPDSILWCQQCTDYFCASCFFNSHKSARGKKHWPQPIPGCRYLTASEAARLKDHLPLLNVGFSMRRRFLARDNQSDKNGSRSGDTWLFFHADTFEAALLQAPEKHWYLKRLKPPRLAPAAEGYYYNFGRDVIADDSSHIMTKAHEQKAIALLQKNIRGALTRKRIKKEIKAATIIQKSKRMWDVQRDRAENDKFERLLRGWYQKWSGNTRKEKLLHSTMRLQAVYRGYWQRKQFQEMLHTIVRFQSKWRSTLTRRRAETVQRAVECIQRYYRGHMYGRRPMADMHKNCSKIQAMLRGATLRELNRFKAKSAAYVQAHWRGHWVRLVAKKKLKGAILIQANWRRFQAQLDVKIILYNRMEVYRLKRMERIRFKLEEAAATLIQRNYRRFRDYHAVVLLRRQKGDADKKISTLLAAFYTAAGEMRHYVHPWWRHLPPDMQEILSQVKASMQRTIGLMPATGKIWNEEIGCRGLRVPGADLLVYKSEEVDLASHMLISVTRHLLSHIPADVFPSTVDWACYAIGHQAVGFAQKKGYFQKEAVPVGKENPPHPHDTLNSLWDTTGTVKHHHDWLMSLPEESIPCLILNGIPPNHRHVALTAEVLVTMRQALESPSISTEDHLRFQGLDKVAGAQLMEVMSSELDRRLPPDWPKEHGTVAALAVQMSTYIKELPVNEVVKEEVKKEDTAAKAKAKGKAAAKGKAGDKTAKKKTPSSSPTGSPDAKGGTGGAPALPEGGMLSYFNRNAVMRILQQVGFFMRGQDEVMSGILAKASPQSPGDTGKGRAGGNRYVSVTDKLFEMADRATHDHCSFVLAVVLLHMVLRGLMLRVLYHRAAMTIQKRYRYVKLKGRKANAVGPAICIQRFWRGTKVSFDIMHKDDAAWKIQRSYKAWKWNIRSRQLMKSVLRIQRVWHSSVHRKWIRSCHEAAVVIQRHARAFAIRLVLDKEGRALTRTHRAQMLALTDQVGELSVSEYIARTALLAGKIRIEVAKHRAKNLDLIHMESLSGQSVQARVMEKQRRLRYKGATQPARETVFEPLIFALARINQRDEPQKGAEQTRVFGQVVLARKQLERWLPRATSLKPHAASKRGRMAVFVRRLYRKARESGKPMVMPVIPEGDDDVDITQMHEDDMGEIDQGNAFDETMFSQFISRLYHVKAIPRYGSSQV
eukprot:TRINITY_DN4049_c0_g2_i1.p1 TRINITY_DN4049_c0_g2~~TRINITY_DN4049_c0_g2_i1.p1  ORF type:complete len:1832 (-),score=407.81 TRINITY_DN4049_c0_g2_i1:158-5284(-)